MDSTGWLTFLFLIFLIMMSGFFSATETAFSSVNKIRLKAMAEDGNRKAKKALEIEEQYDRTISSILVGNNVVNIAAASVSTAIALRTGFMGEAGVAASTVIMTVVVLIFGEVLPKTYAKYNAEKLALSVCNVIKFLLILMWPVTALLLKIQNAFMKMSRTEIKPSVTEKELLNIIETIEEEGVIDEQRSELMQSVIAFNETTVQEVMTPRVDLSAVLVSSSPEEILKTITEERFTRIPVYEKNLDNIIGILHAKDYFESLLKKDTKSLRDVISKPYFVYRSQKVSNVLNELRLRHIHLAVVLDDYGGTMGIVTMEDLLEELVGEIYDEDEETESDFSVVQKGVFSVSGDYNIYEALKNIGYDDRNFESDYSSVGGWAFEQLEKIPTVGESFCYDGITVKIMEMDDQRVTRVVIEYNPLKE